MGVIVRLALLLAAAPVLAAPPSAVRAFMGPSCVGDYADDLSALAPRAREHERQPYSHCVRSIAVYECLSYGGEGNVRRTRRRVVAHGTAFGYKRQAGETLLVTNQHVAEWPAVTDEDHPVEGVPPGCKRVSDALRVVDGESDAYERDDVALQRVVSDPQLDVAVLRAHAPLSVLPWRIGRSSALRERNVVEVRGFPLGAFQATNVGKVISALDRDTYHEWDHDDFVVDALLSSGNSGSPVLAVSCHTGEFELVGIYHAGYSEGSALNVVVGIDQVRDLLTTLKRSPRRGDTVAALEARDRERLRDDPQRTSHPFFPFGNLVAAVRLRSDGALLFEVLSRDFPLKTHPIFVAEDLPDPTGQGFGELGRVWLGTASGLKGYERGQLDAETQALAQRVHELLRRDALAAFGYRAAAREGSTSRERYDAMVRLERTLRRTTAARRESAQGIAELADRLGPHGAEAAGSYSDLFVVPAGPPSAEPTRTADAVLEAEQAGSDQGRLAPAPVPAPP